MYELFVLSELMEGPKSGYRLREIMETTLGPNRKISFGVLYPLLNKLAESGYILIENPEDRKKRSITITDAGEAHFKELMKEPIPRNAHTDDLYLIRLDAMQHVDVATQLQILDGYKEEQLRILSSTKAMLNDFGQTERKADHLYAERILKLRQLKTETTIGWIRDYESELKE
ncbi:PadR family transcriptional regulator [Pediococcus argentinicus]|uniref:PadR family transcriptional regulator n=1 Tax=Pediococcus argentinicus TaxID=480391 RepID=UPI00338F1307